MPNSRRDVRSESAASVASLQEFVSGFQKSQFRNSIAFVAPLIGPAVVRRLRGGQR